jgi:hypothetical protein
MTAAGQGVRAAGEEIEIRAKVMAVDYVGRTAVLKGPKGNMVTVDVPVEVRNFEQVKVGDELVARYARAVAAKLERVNKTGARERVETMDSARAEPGAKPGMAVARKVEILATIQSVDVKKRQVTLRGAERVISLDVPSDINIKNLKKADDVRAAFFEAVMVTVEEAK